MRSTSGMGCIISGESIKARLLIPTVPSSQLPETKPQKTFNKQRYPLSPITHNRLPIPSRFAAPPFWLSTLQARPLLRSRYGDLSTLD